MPRRDKTGPAGGGALTGGGRGGCTPKPATPRTPRTPATGVGRGQGGTGRGGQGQGQGRGRGLGRQG